MILRESVTVETPHPSVEHALDQGAHAVDWRTFAKLCRAWRTIRKGRT